MWGICGIGRGRGAIRRCRYVVPVGSRKIDAFSTCGAETVEMEVSKSAHR